MGKKTNNLDYYILIPAVTLALFGIVNVFSASSNMASGSPFSFLIKQTFFVFVAVIVGTFLFKMRLNYLMSSRFLRIMLWIIIMLLAFARFIAPPVNGAHGWIMLPGFSLQPAEFAKVALIVYFANFFARHPYQKGHALETTFKGGRWFLPSIILVLILVMPDMGNFAINGFIVMVMLLASGIAWYWAAGAFSAFGIIWVILPKIIETMQIDPQKHYSLARLVAFVNPWEYQQSSGTQLINSYYAISNGGLFGVGLGNSIQKTGYLPEPNTDFIMAVVGEEWGAIVIVIVLALMGIIIGRIIQVGTRTHETYIRIMMYGIAAYLTIQVLINLGGVSGVLPITGVTFPFISYGGSSMLVLSIAIGLAMNASATVSRARQMKVIQEKTR
ncbi:FtsW/RodA/SpoVE family cell cycle protein [Periweissella cryptocerci]|uniref:Probable peptidoglycan glycosyltransferase FtsW n=1 Tax=Periweissella cryptocerci TaxID=2506420 RepID=A0A4P6YVP8_9LACO|nr:FtsW/RodA/SpoVE family cell cycle protein [Periweissella cryptocerci]QBO36884.1 FtsW/RodA/SpoVE family cell cycle protein [Periweissella cryptocerci]